MEQPALILRTAAHISVFDMLKIGIGPSSSHTLGPMRAARRFRHRLEARSTEGFRRLRIELFGSLAATGRGHRTDQALCAGLLDLDPAESPVEAIWQAQELLRKQQGLPIGGALISFRPDEDVLWDPASGIPLAHPNTLRFVAESDGNESFVLTARSVGGGFVEYEGDTPAAETSPIPSLPCPFDSAAELVQLCADRGLYIAEVAVANEKARGISETELRLQLSRIWSVMSESIERGLAAEGTLPGGLNVRRRAPQLHRRSSMPHIPNGRRPDLLASAYAMAVSEENAAGGRIVTAPTNGAAGVLPAVIRQISEERPLTPTEIEDGLMVAAVIGAIVKRQASISGAEIGCQGEIGTSSAMAAATAVHLLGGSVRQAEQAAEIAIEHHLGMTCDPVCGLVQIPCIERNAMGVVKALNAAALALASDGSHQVSLDRALRVMQQTGLDMQDQYKETATGGLGVG